MEAAGATLPLSKPKRRPCYSTCHQRAKNETRFAFGLLRFCVCFALLCLAWLGLAWLCFARLGWFPREFSRVSCRFSRVSRGFFAGFTRVFAGFTRVFAGFTRVFAGFTRVIAGFRGVVAGFRLSVALVGSFYTLAALAGC